VAILANNHVYDCLEKGFKNTIQFFETNNIRYLGAGSSQIAAQQPLTLTIKGMKVVLLNYVAPDTHPSIPSYSKLFLNTLDDERMLREIKNLKSDADVIIVNLHWGMEHLQYPSIEQRTLARRAVETGATIVACHHPHCLQGHEAWKNGHIFYSLGNFLFGGLDQWKKHKWPSLSSATAMATCIVSRSGVARASLTYLRQKKLTLKIAETPRIERKQNKLNRRLNLDDRKYEDLYKRSLLFRKYVILPWCMISVWYGWCGTSRKIFRAIIQKLNSVTINIVK